VRYEVEFDDSTLGSHSRTLLIKPSAFRLLAGAGDLEDQQFGALLGHNQACRHCGVRPFGKGHLRVLGGDFFAINVATLDRLAPERHQSRIGSSVSTWR
jgi:hypothetical protein